MARSAAEAAACTVFADLDAAPLTALREGLGPDLGSRRPTVSHLLAAAVARALVAHPALNAHLEGDVLHVAQAVHLGLAVALPDGGLVAPVLRDAHLLAAPDLADAARTLTDRARAGTLRPDDVRGATFTLSNAGPARTPRYATPLVPLPQVAILAATAIRPEPVARGGAVSVGETLPVSLTFDHRALNGAAANAFLEDLAARLAAPEALMRPPRQETT